MFLRGRCRHEQDIVDDEKGIVAIMQNYFEMAGFQVVAAYSGKEALEKVTCQPDIVLLDINMPDIDGLAVCQSIREHIACPILFLTARIETADKIKGFSVGADDYIVNPFDLDELGARVAAHLRRENRKQEQSIVKFFDGLTIDYKKSFQNTIDDLTKTYHHQRSYHASFCLYRRHALSRLKERQKSFLSDFPC